MTMLSHRLLKASRDYECYGCGECPIHKGTYYYRVTWLRDGKIETQRYCQRCHMVLLNKLNHMGKKKEIPAVRGAFKLSRLSNVFRKKWTKLCVDLNSMSDEDREGRPGAELILSVAEELTNGAQFKTEKEMEQNRASEETRRKWHPAAKKLVVLRRQARKLNKELKLAQDDIVKANLTLRTISFASGLERKEQTTNELLVACITRMEAIGRELSMLTEK